MMTFPTEWKNKIQMLQTTNQFTLNGQWLFWTKPLVFLWRKPMDFCILDLPSHSWFLGHFHDDSQT
jgi:hypothetical protein